MKKYDVEITVYDIEEDVELKVTLGEIPDNSPAWEKNPILGSLKKQLQEALGLE